MIYYCYIITKSVINYQKLGYKKFYEKTFDKQTALYYNVYVSNRGAVAVPRPPYRGAVASTFTKLSHTFHKTITIG